MTRIKPIKIKAALLAGVFSLNTLIGFACSVHLDMGFNRGHHGHGAAGHFHETGESLIHSGAHHHHSQVRAHNPDKPVPPEKEKHQDNCCSGQVKQFEELDKSVPQAFQLVHPGFLQSFTDYFFAIQLPSGIPVKNTRPFARSHHPPIPDIRLAIRSFQI